MLAGRPEDMAYLLPHIHDARWPLDDATALPAFNAGLDAARAWVQARQTEADAAVAAAKGKGESAADNSRLLQRQAQPFLALDLHSFHAQVIPKGK